MVTKTASAWRHTLRETRQAVRNQSPRVGRVSECLLTNLGPTCVFNDRRASYTLHGLRTRRTTGEAPGAIIGPLPRVVVGGSMSYRAARVDMISSGHTTFFRPEAAVNM